MIKELAIGCDHAGFGLKEKVKAHLSEMGIRTEDFGTYTEDSVDYPDFAHQVASSVEKGEFKTGVLICGSANGVAMSANKHAGVRAAICWSGEITELARLHNNANILCLPARFISEAEAIDFMDIFLNTAFEGGRHERRVNKIPC